MIAGEHNDETLSGLLWCFSTTRALTPCGSRFFGDAKDYSDFDFVSEEGSIPPEELTAGGFSEAWNEKKKEYADLNTITCWARGKVHVIICKSLVRRLAARAHIQQTGKNRKDITVWDEFYASNP